MESTTDSLRNTRDYLLKTTDWTQVGDITLENGDEWVAYRQGLRDLPSLETPIWPEPPQVKIIEGVDLNNRVKRLEDEIKTHTHPSLEDEIKTHTNPSLEERLNTHTHPLEEHTHPLEEHTHPLEEHTHPLEEHTHPLEEHTHPLEPHTHPLEEHTHPEIAIEKAKTHELQQRLTLIEHSHAALVARLEALENI
jgi:predicted RNase H-like nuclease (RuvC/YqgF family)